MSGDFTIMESGNVCCVGKVRTTDDYVLSLQSVMVEEAALREKDDFEINMTSADFYKDIKILGYDYGPKFRRITKVKTNDFEKLHGEIEWDGNWITFMDSLLQTMAAAMPFRKMMVPVMIRSLRCDPKTMYEGITANKFTENKAEDLEEKVHEDDIQEMLARQGGNDEAEVEGVLNANSVDYIEELFGKEFHVYKSNLPFMADMNTRTIVTYGVEIEDLMAFPIPRKSNVQDLKLESYQFVANEDTNAIEECDKQVVKEYLKVCSSMANKIKEMVDSKKPANVEITDENVKSYLADIKDNQVLLNILNELYKSCLDENQNINTNQFLTEILNKPEYDMSLDMINAVSKNEHLVRTFLDIVSESYVPKKEIRVLEVNLTNGVLANEVDTHLATSHIYPIDVSYTCAVKSIDTLGEDLKNKGFKLMEWKHKESNFPTDVTSTDLIIVKDCPEMWDIDLENHLQEAYDCVINKGFLLAIFRHQLTEPELALNQMNGKKSLKNSDLEKRIADYSKMAVSVGFSVIGRKCDSIGSVTLLFRKMLLDGVPPTKDNIIEINSNCEGWFEKLKDKIVEMKEKEEKDENIWLIAKDSPKNGVVGLINCLRLEPGGESIRCLFDFDNVLKTPINFKEKPFKDILDNDLPINVMKNGKLGTYRHLTLTRFYDKIESDEYFLNIGATRDLSGLQWFDMRNLATPQVCYDMINQKVNRIPCNIYYTGMNFRDVMTATGMSHH